MICNIRVNAIASPSTEVNDPIEANAVRLHRLVSSACRTFDLSCIKEPLVSVTPGRLRRNSPISLIEPYMTRNRSSMVCHIDHLSQTLRYHTST